MYTIGNAKGRGLGLLSILNHINHTFPHDLILFSDICGNKIIVTVTQKGNVIGIV